MNITSKNIYNSKSWDSSFRKKIKNDPEAHLVHLSTLEDECNVKMLKILKKYPHTTSRKKLHHLSVQSDLCTHNLRLIATQRKYAKKQVKKRKLVKLKKRKRNASSSQPTPANTPIPREKKRRKTALLDQEPPRSQSSDQTSTDSKNIQSAQEANSPQTTGLENESLLQSDVFWIL